MTTTKTAAVEKADGALNEVTIADTTNTSYESSSSASSSSTATMEGREAHVVRKRRGNRNARKKSYGFWKRSVAIFFFYFTMPSSVLFD